MAISLCSLLTLLRIFPLNTAIGSVQKAIYSMVDYGHISVHCLHFSLNTVNPERIASVIFNDFINPATLTSLYDNDFSHVLHAHAHNVAH